MAIRVWIAVAAAAVVGSATGAAAGQLSGNGSTTDSTGPVAASTPAGSASTDLPATVPPGPVTGNLVVGDLHLDVETTVDAQGGEIVVSGGDLDGMTVVAAEGSFADGTTLTISHASILDETYGDAVTALSPLIEVAVNGASDARADVPVEITVPATRPADFFGMGLLWDGSGELEGMPVLGWGDEGVSILTSQLGRFFLSGIRPDDLPEELFTGFMVAKDNWQFVNEGSWLAPGGICAGMTISSMWYYLELRRPLDAPQLYRQYDFPHGSITPWFGRDDAHAIRMASMVQNDIRWGEAVWKAFRSARYEDIGWYQYQAFRYSMYLTNEPQYATLGISPTVSGGHAVVAYGFSGPTIWIADPNYPFYLNRLEYLPAQGAFEPYTGGLTASESQVFSHIGYAGKRALVDWSLVGQRYVEMVAGVVGDTAFPVPHLVQRLLDANGTPVWQPAQPPVAEADGTVTLAVGASSMGGTGGWVSAEFMMPGTSDAVQTSWVWVDGAGNNSVYRPAVLTPGVGGGTYSVLIRASHGGGGTTIVDSISVGIQATPATTTTTTTTIPPTSTAPTTAAPTTAAPTTVAVATTAPVDCSTCPDGIAGIECRLHCEAIS